MGNDSFVDAFGALNAALDARGDSVLVLPLSAIVEDPNNPRSHFDQAELDGLAQTIREKGLLQPITVRPAGPDGRHVICFGARRFRAAQAAGLKDIRVLVRAGEHAEQGLLLEQLIENEQRQGLTTSDQARAVDRLLALKLSQSEIARRLGRPRDQVALLAAIKAMPPPLQSIADEVGPRTLFELNAAWKRDEARVSTWLAGRAPATITQAQARALAGRPSPNVRQVRDPTDGSITLLTREASSAPNPARQATTPAAPKTLSATAVFEVTAAGVSGELILDNVARSSANLRVRGADGKITAVPADQVRIVRVRPA